MSIPHRCPDCVTDDKYWAYGRLVFPGEDRPTCPLCGGVILPVISRNGAKPLTGEQTLLRSGQVAPLLLVGQDRKMSDVTPTNRVGAVDGNAASQE